MLVLLLLLLFLSYFLLSSPIQPLAINHFTSPLAITVIYSVCLSYLQAELGVVRIASALTSVFISKATVEENPLPSGERKKEKKRESERGWEAKITITTRREKKHVGDNYFKANLQQMYTTLQRLPSPSLFSSRLASTPSPVLFYPIYSH